MAREARVPVAIAWPDPLFVRGIQAPLCPFSRAGAVRAGLPCPCPEGTLDPAPRSPSGPPPRSTSPSAVTSDLPPGESRMREKARGGPRVAALSQDGGVKLLYM